MCLAPDSQPVDACSLCPYRRGKFARVGLVTGFAQANCWVFLKREVLDEVNKCMAMSSSTVCCARKASLFSVHEGIWGHEDGCN